MLRILLKNKVLFFALFCTIPLMAQFQRRRSQMEEGLPQFHFDIASYKAQENGKNNLKFMLKIPFDELQFVQEENYYEAGYELSVSIQTKKKEHVDSKIVKKHVRVPDFSQTNSRQFYSFADTEFILDSGEYEVIIHLMDLDSKKTRTRKGKVSLVNYSQLSFGISDLLLLDQVSVDSSNTSFYMPNVLWNFYKSQESIYLQYEIYNKEELTTVPVTYKIKDMDNAILQTSTHEIELDGIVTRDFIEIKKNKLISGKYYLELIVGEGEFQATKQRLLTVEWVGMPVGAKTMDKAIEQLRYIASGKFLRRLRKADNKEKVRLFREFWAERDPSPNSEENELMDVYYQRVDFANINYKEQKDGWDTDRGMVYIILGPPDEIDRHPFDSGSRPYEIWNYNYFARSLFFMDYTGFGEYRLIPDSWEVFSQMR